MRRPLRGDPSAPGSGPAQLLDQCTCSGVHGGRLSRRLRYEPGATRIARLRDLRLDALSRVREARTCRSRSVIEPLEARMPGQDWQTLAEEILKPKDKADELVTTRTSDITKLGAAVTTLVGVVMTTLFGANFAWNGQQVESVVAAALIVSTCIAGVLLVYASDFRTRGRVAAARFDAITRIAQQHIESDVAGLQSKLTAVEAEANAAHAELVETLVAALEKAGPVIPDASATSTVPMEDVIKAILKANRKQPA